MSCIAMNTSFIWQKWKTFSNSYGMPTYELFSVAWCRHSAHIWVVKITLEGSHYTWIVISQRSLLYTLWFHSDLWWRLCLYWIRLFVCLLPPQVGQVHLVCVLCCCSTRCVAKGMIPLSAIEKRGIIMYLFQLMQANGKFLVHMIWYDMTKLWDIICLMWCRLPLNNLFMQSNLWLVICFIYTGHRWTTSQAQQTTTAGADYWSWWIWRWWWHVWKSTLQ